MSGLANRIPHFLKSMSSQELMGLMLSNNLKDGREYTYQIVFNSSDKNWYAWFYKEVDIKAQFNNRNE